MVDSKLSAFMQILKTFLGRLVSSVYRVICCDVSDEAPLFEQTEIVHGLRPRTFDDRLASLVGNMESLGNRMQQRQRLFVQGFVVRCRCLSFHVFYLLLKLLDTSLKWLHLRFKMQVL